MISYNWTIVYIIYICLADFDRLNRANSNFALAPSLRRLREGFAGFAVGDHVIESLVQFAQIPPELSANSLAVLNALFDCPAVDFHVKPLRGHMRLLQPFKVQPANFRSIRRLQKLFTDPILVSLHNREASCSALRKRRSQFWRCHARL